MGLNACVLRDSFALVVSREEFLTMRIYACLFERHPSVKPIFARNSPMHRRRVMQETMVAILEHLEDPSWLTRALPEMGRRNIDHGFTPIVYDWVGECFLLTLREIAGKDWSHEMESAWVEACDDIVRLMRSAEKTAA